MTGPGDSIKLLKLDQNCTREQQILTINAILDLIGIVISSSDEQILTLSRGVDGHTEAINRLIEIINRPIITADEIEQTPKKRGRPKKLPDLQDDLEGRN